MSSLFPFIPIRSAGLSKNSGFDNPDFSGQNYEVWTNFGQNVHFLGRKTVVNKGGLGEIR